MSNQKEVNERLNHYGELHQKLCHDTREILKKKTDDELKQLIEDVKTLTTTNCWWATYEVRGIVKHEANVILKSREAKSHE